MRAALPVEPGRGLPSDFSLAALTARGTFLFSVDILSFNQYHKSFVAVDSQCGAVCI
jgi:hypothetical protein